MPALLAAFGAFVIVASLIFGGLAGVLEAETIKQIVGFFYLLIPLTVIVAIGVTVLMVLQSIRSDPLGGLAVGGLISVLIVVVFVPIEFIVAMMMAAMYQEETGIKLKVDCSPATPEQAIQTVLQMCAVLHG